MENYKIKVNNEAESKEAQDLFEQLGFKWAVDHLENGDWYSHLYAENSTCCYLSPYVWGGLADRFKEITLSKLRDLVAQKQGLISGADAKLAWAKGEDLLIDTGAGFHDLTDNYYLAVFDRDLNKFKRKPRTITLNVEIPAPFHPKSGDMVWCLSELSEKGYEARTAYDAEDFIPHIAYWRTEEEIKQVVAALRGGIKG